MLSLDASLPDAACDCHVHVFEPDRFSYSPDRSYTPPAAPISHLRAFHQALGVQRAVLVQPSCYGTDNRALLAALQELGYERARGVAVLKPEAVGDEELNRLRALGIRGLRLNFHAQGSGQAGRDCQIAAERIEALGWHLNVHCGAAALDALAPILRRLPVPVVLDHFGGGPAAGSTLLRLAACEHIWVKLSAPYRWTAALDELRPLVRSLMDRAAHRLVWASDWPHTGGHGARTGSPLDVEPFRNINVAADLQELRAMVADETRFHQLLAGNPARLYGF